VYRHTLVTSEPLTITERSITERQTKSQIPLRYLVRSWSATSFEPAANQLA